MLFNSLQFICFFSVVISLYFILSQKWRIYLLLLASYYFYMCWKPEYVLLILGSTLIDFFVAKKIYSSTEGIRKRWLVLSISINLGVLILFKYFNFFSENISILFESMNIFYDQPFFDLLLPVGISFYTFQTLSYSIDVYNKRVKPEGDFPRFALFVSFFPQLVAGPIERSSHLLPQFKAKHQFKYNRVVSGLRLMLWGFFKKVVIADNLARLVDQVYNNPIEQNGVTYLLATYFFAFQIYCDFSGYSDIAIGSARIMGFDLMKNFKQPYLSKSMRDFWSRWHISLSTWFRDYVYIPLGGNRTVKWKRYYNLLITFLISGLWHGSNWTFLIWGALHGIFLIMELMVKKSFGKSKILRLKWLRLIFIFHLIVFSWVFFRAPSISNAITIFHEISLIPDIVSQYLNGTPILLGLGELKTSTVAYFALLIVIIYITDLMIINEKIRHFYMSNKVIRMVSYFVLFYWILLGGYFGKTTFIYFQF